MKKTDLKNKFENNSVFKNKIISTVCELFIRQQFYKRRILGIKNPNTILTSVSTFMYTFCHKMHCYRNCHIPIYIKKYCILSIILRNIFLMLSYHR